MIVKHNYTEQNNATDWERLMRLASRSWEDNSNVAGATIRIVEKDDDGNDDDVTTLNAAVEDGKIKCKWKVIYTGDDDDTNSAQEKEEKGYTLPEYAFTVECDGAESGESGQLDVCGLKFNILINQEKAFGK